jgi:hypothetical protein
MNPNLIATPIVDKNGRSTTVLKKPGTGTSASLRVANIKPVLPSAPEPQKPSETPLPPLDTITKDELFRLGSEHRFTERSHSDHVSVDSLVAHATPESWALVKKVLDSGADASVVTHLTYIHEARVETWWNSYANGAEHAIASLNNSLLVVERLEREYPDLKHWNGGEQAQIVSRALEAYTKMPKQEDCIPLKQFKTVEELDSAVAVSAYILNAERNHGGLMGRFINNTNFFDSDAIHHIGTMIANRSLDTYLRERPHELGRIMKYMEDHEFGNTKQDTNELIRFLDETSASPSLSDGWL